MKFYRTDNESLIKINTKGSLEDRQKEIVEKNNQIIKNLISQGKKKKKQAEEKNQKTTSSQFVELHNSSDKIRQLEKPIFKPFSNQLFSKEEIENLQYQNHNKTLNSIYKQQSNNNTIDVSQSDSRFFDPSPGLGLPSSLIKQGSQKALGKLLGNSKNFGNLMEKQSKSVISLDNHSKDLSNSKNSNRFSSPTQEYNELNQGTQKQTHSILRFDHKRDNSNHKTSTINYNNNNNNLSNNRSLNASSFSKDQTFILNNKHNIFDYQLKSFSVRPSFSSLDFPIMKYPNDSIQLSPNYSQNPQNSTQNIQIDIQDELNDSGKSSQKPSFHVANDTAKDNLKFKKITKKHLKDHIEFAKMDFEEKSKKEQIYSETIIEELQSILSQADIEKLEDINSEKQYLQIILKETNDQTLEQTLQKSIPNLFTAKPPTREETRFLINWYQQVVKTIQLFSEHFDFDKFSLWQSTLTILTKEIVRQVSLDCQERGFIINKALTDIYQIYQNIALINQNELQSIKKQSKKLVEQNKKDFNMILDDMDSNILSLAKELKQEQEKVERLKLSLEELEKENKHVRNETYSHKQLLTKVVNKTQEILRENQYLKAQKSKQMAQLLQKGILKIEDIQERSPSKVRASLAELKYKQMTPRSSKDLQLIKNNISSKPIIPSKFSNNNFSEALIKLEQEENQRMQSLKLFSPQTENSEGEETQPKIESDEQLEEDIKSVVNETENTIIFENDGEFNKIDYLNLIAFGDPEKSQKYDCNEAQTGKSLLYEVYEVETQTNLCLIDMKFDDVLQDNVTFERIFERIMNQDEDNFGSFRYIHDSQDSESKNIISLNNLDENQKISNNFDIFGDMQKSQFIEEEDKEKEEDSSTEFNNLEQKKSEYSKEQSIEKDYLKLTSSNNLTVPKDNNALRKQLSMHQEKNIQTNKTKLTPDRPSQITSQTSKSAKTITPVQQILTKQNSNSALLIEQQTKQKDVAEQPKEAINLSGKRGTLIIPLTKTSAAPKLGQQVTVDKYQVSHESVKAMTEKLKTKKFSKFQNFMPLPMLFQQISYIYYARIKAVNENARNQDIQCVQFVYQYLTKNYGFKQMVDQKYIILILSIKKNMSHLRVNNFAKFIGLIDPKENNFTLDEFNQFIETLNYILNISTVGSPASPVDTEAQYYIPFIRAIAVFSSFVDSRLTNEENSELRKEIELLKENDPQNVHQYGIVDFDNFVLKFLLTFRSLLQRAKLYVINAFAASDLDGNGYCNFGEFTTLITHIEKEKNFKIEDIQRIFDDSAEEIDGELNLTFDKFAVVSVENQLFTDEAQDRFLKIKSKKEIDIKMHDLRLSWKLQIYLLKQKIESLKIIDLQDKEKWLEILSVLNEKITSNKKIEPQPILIAYEILVREVEEIQQQNQLAGSSENFVIEQKFIKRTSSFNNEFDNAFKKQSLTNIDMEGASSNPSISIQELIKEKENQSLNQMIKLISEKIKIIDNKEMLKGLQKIIQDLQENRKKVKDYLNESGSDDDSEQEDQDQKLAQNYQKAFLQFQIDLNDKIIELIVDQSQDFNQRIMDIVDEKLKN